MSTDRIAARRGYHPPMAKKGTTGKPKSISPAAPVHSAGRPSALLDARVVYCGDNLEQLAKPALSLSNGLPDACVDLIYMDPAQVSEVELPFNSNRNYRHAFVGAGEFRWM
jgi:hypothetical protein